MGSGAVGVEFASIFRRFGSDVTILELLPRLVPVEDEAVSAELEKSFRKQGITAHTGARVTSATATATASTSRLQLADGQPQTLQVDYLLVATGRGPVTTGLDVGARRARSSRRATSRSTRSTAPTCPASRRSATSSRSGATPHPQLAHVSSAEGIVAAERIAGRETRPLNYDHVPGCTYCDPGDRQRRADRARSAGARLRRARRHVPVRRARPREDGGRDRRLRQDRRREEVRRGARRPHDRPALDRARRGGHAWRCGSNRRSRS